METGLLTVGRLREFLAGFEDETPVLVDGYESGFEPMTAEIVKVGVTAKVQGEWWRGRYANDPDGTAALVFRR